MMIQKKKNDLSDINSIEDLQLEQRRLKLRIRQQEQELRKRVQQVPGELFYAGVNSVVPPLLSGKVTSSVLNAGKQLINMFVKKDADGNTPKLVAAIKQAGIFTVLRIAFKAFIQRK